jgi:hypothetical protein
MFVHVVASLFVAVYTLELLKVNTTVVVPATESKKRTQRSGSGGEGSHTKSPHKKERKDLFEDNAPGVKRSLPQEEMISLSTIPIDTALPYSQKENEAKRPSKRQRISPENYEQPFENKEPRLASLAHPEDASKEAASRGGKFSRSNEVGVKREAVVDDVFLNLLNEHMKNKVPPVPERDEEEIEQLFAELEAEADLPPPPLPPRDDELVDAPDAPPPPPPPVVKAPGKPAPLKKGPKKEIAEKPIDMMDQLKGLLAKRNAGEFQLRKADRAQGAKAQVEKKLTKEEMIANYKKEIDRNTAKIERLEQETVPDLDAKIADADLTGADKSGFVKGLAAAKKEIERLRSTNRNLNAAVKLTERQIAAGAVRKAKADAGNEVAPTQQQIKKRVLNAQEIADAKIQLKGSSKIFDMLSEQSQFYLVKQDKQVFEKLSLLKPQEIEQLEEQLAKEPKTTRYGDLRKSEVLARVDVAKRKAALAVAQAVPGNDAAAGDEENQQPVAHHGLLGLGHGHHHDNNDE